MITQGEGFEMDFIDDDSDLKISAVEDSAYFSTLSGCITNTRKEAVDHKKSTHGYDDNDIMNHQTTNLMRFLTNSTPCVQKFWSNP